MVRWGFRCFIANPVDEASIIHYQPSHIQDTPEVPIATFIHLHPTKWTFIHCNMDIPTANTLDSPLAVPITQALVHPPSEDVDKSINHDNVPAKEDPSSSNKRKGV